MTPAERFAEWVEWVGSQQRAAELIGCTQPTVSAIVRGLKLPGLRTAHGIADAMRVPAEDGACYGRPAIETRDWIEV